MSFRFKYLNYAAALFIIINFLIFLLIRYNTEARIATIQAKHLDTLRIHYTIFLHNEKRLAELIHRQTVQNDEVMQLLSRAYDRREDAAELAELRAKLQAALAKNYAIYQENSVLQYHFVFPDNVSFLRMHKPNRFGDDLTGIREDFERVNATLAPVSGFTQGRVAHAFRNAWPLFDADGRHIGAFEASFPSEMLQTYLNDVSAVHSHFLIHKKVFDAKAWQRDDLILEYRRRWKKGYRSSTTRRRMGAIGSSPFYRSCSRSPGIRSPGSSRMKMIP